MPYQLGEGPTLNLAVRVGVGPTIALSGRPVNSRVQYHSAHRTSSHNARRPQKIASFWGLVCIFALWGMSLRPLSSCRTITLRLCGRWRVCEIMESGLHVFHSTTGHFLCQEIFSRNFIIPKKRGAVPAAPSSLGFCIPKVNALFLTKSIVAQFRIRCKTYSQLCSLFHRWNIQVSSPLSPEPQPPLPQLPLEAGGQSQCCSIPKETLTRYGSAGYFRFRVQ